MNRIVKWLLLAGTHTAAVGFGFILGIYALPILTAPPGPSVEDVQAVAEEASHRGTFHRDLEDSDALHWGEGDVFLTGDAVAFEGKLAPGPDYRLYLSPQFVETETAFKALKSSMVAVGDIRSFEGFMLALPETVSPDDYTAVIVWCESFEQFITAAAYR